MEVAGYTLLETSMNWTELDPSKPAPVKVSVEGEFIPVRFGVTEERSTDPEEAVTV
jgi:hypothetical protein